ncbi:hypothetical protein V1281_004943 [Nitrobacteraceae bacterium AZCC 2161]
MPIARTSRMSTAPHPMRRAGDIVIEAVEVKAGVALVPVAPPLRAAPVSSSLSRPDPSFIAHLIAMAEQSPQTRVLRRAEIADVEAAYRAVGNQNAAGSAISHTRRMA